MFCLLIVLSSFIGSLCLVSVVLLLLSWLALSYNGKTTNGSSSAAGSATWGTKPGETGLVDWCRREEIQVPEELRAVGRTVIRREIETKKECYL